MRIVLGEQVTPVVVGPVQAVVAIRQVSNAVLVTIDTERAELLGLGPVAPAAIRTSWRVVYAARIRYLDAAGEQTDTAIVPRHLPKVVVVLFLGTDFSALGNLVVPVTTVGPAAIFERYTLVVCVLTTDRDESAIPVVAPDYAQRIVDACALIRYARVSLNLEAIKVLAQDDVCNTRDRVGTVD